MVRVVIDTNVIISALLAHHSKPAEIIALVSNGRIKLYYSDGILSEYAEVISRNHFGFSVADQNGILSGVRHFGILVEPPESKLDLPDESDRIFYDAAKFASAFLITGNLKHYPAEDFVIAPAEFLTLLA